LVWYRCRRSDGIDGVAEWREHTDPVATGVGVDIRRANPGAHPLAGQRVIGHGYISGTVCHRRRRKLARD